MIPTNNEKYILSVYKRKENTPYEWEDTPVITFFGRPANRMEKKLYRIQKGVNGNNDSVLIYASNLPLEVSIKDRVDFLGKQWTVESVGFYFDETRIVNASLLSEEQIIERCPKGIVLQ